MAELEMDFCYGGVCWGRKMLVSRRDVASRGM